MSPGFGERSTELLYWALEAVNGYLQLADEVGWLAEVLSARKFPLDWLARNFEIAAEVSLEQVTAPTGAQLHKELLQAAELLNQPCP